MKKAEQIISFLWMGFAVWVCIASFGLDLGSFSDPGPGFLPLGTGALLGILATAHLIHVTFRSPDRMEKASPWANVHWERGGYVVMALLLYAVLLPRAGYLIDTFLLMIFLFSILERKRWWVVLGGSLLVIGITYLVFDVWLMVQFPKGFLRML